MLRLTFREQLVTSSTNLCDAKCRSTAGNVANVMSLRDVVHDQEAGRVMLAGRAAAAVCRSISFAFTACCSIRHRRWLCSRVLQPCAIASHCPVCCWSMLTDGRSQQNHGHHASRRISVLLHLPNACACACSRFLTAAVNACGLGPVHQRWESECDWS